ncbi:MAG: HNH endonuclease [Pelagimonas sp.]|nr:HNH endonuclease [Pelagimonas sp.]
MGDIDSHGLPDGYSDSKTYFLHHPTEGHTYPPKAVWGIASNQSSKDFNSIKANSELKKLGFKVSGERKPKVHISVISPKDVKEPDKFEGAVTQVTTNRYERNPRLRNLCIEHHREKDGCVRCQVCKMRFEECYGEIGRDFIHVHHVAPLAEAKTESQIDPAEDLKPVCPNCHAMLHKAPNNSAYSLENLREMMTRRRTEEGN